MYHHFNTKRRFALRVTSYILMTLAVIIGVVFVTAWIMGWRFDTESQEIKQISLVHVQSFPAGARVDINGERQSFVTPGRLEVAAGPIEVKLSLKGYQDWVKKVDLKATEVRWLNYARLIPKEIKTTNISNLGSVSDISPSPNKKWAVASISPAGRNFKLINLNNPSNVEVTDMVVPTVIRGETFSILGWDKGSEFLLMSNNYGDIIRLDRRDIRNSINLSIELKQTITTARFSDNANMVYGIINGNLHRLNVSEKTVSDSLVKKIKSFSIYEDKIVYVATPIDGQQEVGVLRDGKTTTIKTFKDDLATVAVFSYYYYRDHVTISHGDEILVIRNPFAEKPDILKKLKFDGGISFLEVSFNGRFVLAWNGGRTLIYDIETDETFRFNTINPTGPPKWLDDYHLTYIVDGNITTDIIEKTVAMTDFDGANKYQLVSGRGTPILSGNQQFLFSIVDTAEGTILQRSNLTL